MISLVTYHERSKLLKYYPFEVLCYKNRLWAVGKEKQSSLTIAILHKVQRTQCVQTVKIALMCS